MTSVPGRSNAGWPCKADSSGADWFQCARGTVGCPRFHDGRSPHCIECAAGGPCRYAHDPPAVEISAEEYAARNTGLVGGAAA